MIMNIIKIFSINDKKNIIKQWNMIMNMIKIFLVENNKKYNMLMNMMKILLNKILW